MRENLLYHLLLVDEADDAHLTGALRAGQRIDLPCLLDALTPHQLRYSLWLIIPDIDDLNVFENTPFEIGQMMRFAIPIEIL